MKYKLDVKSSRQDGGGIVFNPSTWIVSNNNTDFSKTFQIREKSDTEY